MRLWVAKNEEIIEKSGWRAFKGGANGSNLTRSFRFIRPEVLLVGHFL